MNYAIIYHVNYYFRNLLYIVVGVFRFRMFSEFRTWEMKPPKKCLPCELVLLVEILLYLKLFFLFLFLAGGKLNISTRNSLTKEKENVNDNEETKKPKVRKLGNRFDTYSIKHHVDESIKDVRTYGQMDSDHVYIFSHHFIIDHYGKEQRWQRVTLASRR